MPEKMKIVDVYHGDGTIDWTKVRVEGGVGLGVAKASEGLSYADPLFAQNWQAMGADGISRGAYHMLHPQFDGVAQADFFLRTIASAGGLGGNDRLLCLDLELGDGTIDPHQIRVSTRDFMAEIAKQCATAKQWLYSMPSYLSSNAIATAVGQYDLWIAGPGLEQPPAASGWATAVAWQYGFGETGGHVVPGCPGSVDVSWFEIGDHDAYLEYLGIPLGD